MNDTQVLFKTDKTTKRELEAAATELGVTNSAFVNMVVKQALRSKQVVLDFPLEPTSELANMIREADDDYRNDQDITHTNSPDEALAHLDSLMKK